MIRERKLENSAEAFYGNKSGFGAAHPSNDLIDRDAVPLGGDVLCRNVFRPVASAVVLRPEFVADVLDVIHGGTDTVVLWPVALAAPARRQVQEMLDNVFQFARLCRRLGER